MTFEEWLKSTALPDTAKKHLPQALSERSKTKLIHKSDGERILLDAIDDINHGSIEPIDSLVMKRLHGK